MGNSYRFHRLTSSRKVCFLETLTSDILASREENLGSISLFLVAYLHCDNSFACVAQMRFHATARFWKISRANHPRQSVERETNKRSMNERTWSRYSRDREDNRRCHHCRRHCLMCVTRRKRSVIRARLNSMIVVQFHWHRSLPERSKESNRRYSHNKLILRLRKWKEWCALYG